MTTIYGLKDPRDGLFHYVGRTTSRAIRLAHHRAHVARPRHDRDRWIAGLRKEGLYPEMVDLELCPPGAAAKAEEKWIVKLRSSGNPLLNVMLREGRLDQRMVILLQPSQLRQLKDRAKAVGLSASEYLRRLLCDEPIPATAC